MVVTATEKESSNAAGVSRRQFLRVGGLGVFGLRSRDSRAAAQSVESAVESTKARFKRCLYLLLTGGPSQLDTFDPKPDASADIRGPFRAISTAVPGVQLSETLPLLAQRLNKAALIRSLTHDATPIHETSQQLIQTGRLSDTHVMYPSVGSMLSRSQSLSTEMPPYVVLPNLLHDTGVEMWQGQGAGCWGPSFNPIVVDPDATAVHAPVSSPRFREAIQWRKESDHVRRQYGDTPFGRSCLTARRLLEAGTQFVTVNMFDSLANRVTWDCHGSVRWSPGTLNDYRDTLCPDFDRVFAAVLDDLESRGLLSETLVVATGEFGRTPRINECGGRDHWPAVWSAVMAGGGVSGGTVLGESDARGAAVESRPVSPGDIVSAILRGFGASEPDHLHSETYQDEADASAVAPVSPASPVDLLAELTS